MEYTPKPIDTNAIKLSKEILDLIEILSKSEHDNWSLKRIKEGWSYGEKKDGALKKHPHLVPYENLSESEKDCNKKVTLESIKAILALDYRIEAPGISKIESPKNIDNIKTSTLDQFNKSDIFTLKDLMGIWQLKSGFGRKNGVEFYRNLGEQILRIGEPLLAYDVILEGLSEEMWSDDVRLIQLLGLALARSGATLSANEIFRKLNNQGCNDGETIGLLARTYKDLWEMSPKDKESKSYLKSASKYYLSAFQYAEEKKLIDDGIYNGINAATMFMFRGDKEKTKSLIKKVRCLCRQRLEIGKDYWAVASLGEAALIMGDLNEAETRYLESSKIGRNRFADFGSTRHQARLILNCLGISHDKFDHCFQIPNVAVFTGHMIDLPDRLTPRFPGSQEKLVYNEIATHLEKMNAEIGFSSAACGSDILFLEAMLDRNGEINIILPYEKNAFKKDSVEIIPDSTWGHRFEKVLNRATRVITASEYSHSPDPVAFHYSNLLMDGLALLRGQMLKTKVCPLTFWNGQTGDGHGGTSSLVEHWLLEGRTIERIDAEIVLRNADPKPTIPVYTKSTIQPLRNTKPPVFFNREIMAMLFFDVKGYSKLTEEQIPGFVKYFMGKMGCVIDEFKVKPLFKNTWGDALHCVFSSIRDAGNFAINLRDRIGNIRWKEKKLPEDLNFRISLHAGPVFSFEDPILKVRNYTGSHVSRAARIEPVTPPGEIYASQQFAAMASSQGVNDFNCEYIGQVSLPKKSGIIPLYLIKKANKQRKFNSKFI